MRTPDPTIRAGILKAAEQQFAERGYAGTSVQDITDATNVTKPVLYYYFEHKAGLYKALVDLAYDETYRLMQEAIARADTLENQLIEILAAQFEFLLQRRPVLQIAMAAAFAAPGEMPDNMRDRSKGERNFELVHALIKKGLKQGRLNKEFDSMELALGLYGAISFQIMVYALQPEAKPNRQTAERIVRLFLEGGANRRAK